MGIGENLDLRAAWVWGKQDAVDIEGGQCLRSYFDLPTRRLWAYETQDPIN